MITGDFAEDYEVMIPFETLTIVGHTVHVVSPGKKAGDKILTAVHDNEGYQTYYERPGHNFFLNATIEEISPEAYDALVLPGGRAPEYLRLNEKVLEIVRHFARTNKPIAAICHGPQVLAAAGVLASRACTGMPFMMPEVKSAGGKWMDIPMNKAYVDGNLVTAPVWPAVADWLAAFLKVLGTKIEP